MKKIFIIMLLFLMVLSVPVFGADRPCPDMWTDVAGQSYAVTVDNQKLVMEFSGSYAGPCPQGEVSLYIDETFYGTVSYVTDRDIVRLYFFDEQSGETPEIIFVLAGDKLVYIPTEDVLMFTKQ